MTSLPPAPHGPHTALAPHGTASPEASREDTAYDITSPDVVVHDIAAHDVALVVPCFNEAPIIAASLASLRDWFPAALIVVVDDGSRDDTRRAAETAAAGDARVRVLAHAANRGKGRAVASAAPLVAGHAAVIVDADLAFDRAAIQRAIDALRACDIAIGNRRHADSTYAVPVRLFGFLYRRHLLGHLFNRVVRLALGLSQPDTQCGLKAFRADVFQSVMGRLTTDGFAFDLDVLLLAKGLGLRVADVPVAVAIGSGRSSVRLARDGLVVGREVIALVARRFTGAYTGERLARPGLREEKRLPRGY